MKKEDIEMTLTEQEKAFTTLYTEAAVQRYQIRNLQSYTDSRHNDSFSVRGNAVIAVRKDLESDLERTVNALRNHLIKNPIEPSRREALKDYCMEKAQDYTQRKILGIVSDAQNVARKMVVAKTTNNAEAAEVVEKGLEKLTIEPLQYGQNTKAIIRDLVDDTAQSAFVMLHHLAGDKPIPMNKEIVVPYSYQQDTGMNLRATIGDFRQAIQSLHNEGYATHPINVLDEISREKAEVERMHPSREHFETLTNEIDNVIQPQVQNINYYVEQVVSWTESGNSSVVFDAVNRVIDSAKEQGFSRLNILQAVPEKVLSNYQEMYQRFSPDYRQESESDMSR